VKLPNRPLCLNYPIATLLAAALASPMLIGSATAGTYLANRYDPIHLRLGDDTDVGRSTGQVIGLGGFGSGSVINPGDPDGNGFDNIAESTWFLTAAHVITGTPEVYVGLGEEGEFNGGSDLEIYNAVNWYVPDTYTGSVIDGADIALIRVDRPFRRGASRMNLWDGTGSQENIEVEVSGFGRYGNGQTGSIFGPPFFPNQKRVGRNQLDTLSSDGFIWNSDFDIDPDDDLYLPFYEFEYALDNGVSIDQVLDGFSARTNPERDFRIGLEYDTAQGDSGGAHAVGDTIYGITSYGDAVFEGDDVLAGFFTFDSGHVNVAAWRDWIYSTIFQVEQGNEPIGFGDVGVVIGSPGNALDLGGGFGIDTEEPTDPTDPGDPTDPADPDPGDGGDGGDDLEPPDFDTIDDALANLDRNKSVFQRKAQLLQGYKNNELNFTEALDLLGIDASTLSTPEEVASALDVSLEDVDDSDLEGDFLRIAMSKLDQKVSRSALSVADGAIGEFGYFMGLSTIGDPTDRFLTGGDVTSLDELFDNVPEPVNAVVGDLDGDGVVTEEELDQIADAAEDAGFSDDQWLGLVTELIGQLAGDANLDGIVGQADLNVVLQNWGVAGLGWAGGNFNTDETVGQADLNAVLQNWGATNDPPDLSGLPVPEPATAALLALGGLTLLRRRQA
jgi:hypothetical protein